MHGNMQRFPSHHHKDLQQNHGQFELHSFPYNDPLVDLQQNHHDQHYSTCNDTQADGVKTLASWKQNRWRKTNGKEIANVDLWEKVYQRLALATNMGLQIHVVHVKADSTLWKRRRIWKQWWGTNTAGINKGQQLVVQHIHYYFYYFNLKFCIVLYYK